MHLSMRFRKRLPKSTICFRNFCSRLKEMATRLLKTSLTIIPLVVVSVLEVCWLQQKNTTLWQSWQTNILRILIVCPLSVLVSFFQRRRPSIRRDLVAQPTPQSYVMSTLHTTSRKWWRTLLHPTRSKAVAHTLLNWDVHHQHNSQSAATRVAFLERRTRGIWWFLVLPRRIRVPRHKTFSVFSRLRNIDCSWTFIYLF